ncbi:glycosyltransferase family 4 protein [Romboutsia lituseburensis]|uniref:Glycosyltransferase involved in cell wall bisynthesis n=1 Tax=Romboutsia lituseburensis DSM 797 TaxID=1121325 RepID=A0A1G9PJN9_9FIRM|nr:glycosyltransferase family 4 protein [Romboutsia lituseburensis]CEH33398.1 Glycosyl transferase group 1 [Romboutsia lituseburensis]SDL98427.1 Glycosyltransferase involved in cell wall bisynthesis [Romboutsia lituseburensis DSM 797]
MKIAFLCHNVFSNGGVQRVVTNISNLFIDMGYDVDIICTDKKILIDRTKYQLNNKVKVINVERVEEKKIIYLYKKLLRGINKFTNILNRPMFIKLQTNVYYKKRELDEIADTIIRNKYHCVIGCEGYYSVFLGIIKTKLNCKTIGWQHSSYDAYFTSKNKYYGNRENLFKTYLNLLDKNIVLTKSDKLKYEKNLNVFSQVIYNPLSFSNRNISNQQNKVIIAAGRLVYQKGFDMLIEIFKTIKENTKEEWKLHIIGSGDEESKLQNLILCNNLNDYVKIFPFTKDIEKYMLSADIYAMTSRNEGFGLVVTEALQCGLPIVTFETSGPVEIIEGYECGTIVKRYNKDTFAEKILDLINDEDKRTKLSRNAIKRASMFNPNIIIKEWDRLIKSIT